MKGKIKMIERDLKYYLLCLTFIIVSFLYRLINAANNFDIWINILLILAIISMGTAVILTRNEQKEKARKVFILMLCFLVIAFLLIFYSLYSVVLSSIIVQ